MKFLAVILFLLTQGASSFEVCNIDDYPYYVKLMSLRSRKDPELKCSAILLTESWIVVHGTCMKKMYLPGIFRAVAGAQTALYNEEANKYQQVRKIKGYKHSLIRPIQNDYDESICLLYFDGFNMDKLNIKSAIEGSENDYSKCKKFQVITSGEYDADYKVIQDRLVRIPFIKVNYRKCQITEKLLSVCLLYTAKKTTSCIKGGGVLFCEKTGKLLGLLVVKEHLCLTKHINVRASFLNTYDIFIDNTINTTKLMLYINKGCNISGGLMKILVLKYCLKYTIFSI